MHKFYEVAKGQIVKVKKYDRFSVSINSALIPKKFFQGIDSLKKQKPLAVALETHAGINP